MLYDTHAHLNTEAYEETLDEIIKDAKLAGVEYMNIVGFNPVTNKKANEIASIYPGLYATAGLHPAEVDDFTNEDFILLEEYVKLDSTIAVGECGLDYYWNDQNKEKQKEYFKKQIDLSIKYNKPLIIHVRDAMNDAYEVLKEASSKHKINGVMHCFTGSSEMAFKFIELGLYISLGGPVTFKNAKKPKEVAKVIPLDKLLIETDSPYLAPHPYRGKQNKPAFVKLVAEEIASLKDMDLEEVSIQTTINGKKLFKID